MTEHDGVAHSERSADFGALAEGVMCNDAEGRIVDANDAAAPILGLTRDELLGGISRDPHWSAVREDGSPWPGDEHPGMVALRTDEPQRGRIMAPGRGRRWISIHAMPRLARGADKPTDQSHELSELYEKAPCGYHMLDAEGRFTPIKDPDGYWIEIVEPGRLKNLVLRSTNPASHVHRQCERPSAPSH